MTQTPRIGLFVCECGGAISAYLDVPALVQRAQTLPGIQWAGQARYWCSPAGLRRMQSTISEQHLDRAAIAGCAPRTHLNHFRRPLAGLVAPDLVQVLNLRDLCALPHRNTPEPAMAKARDQIAMAIAALADNQAGKPIRASISPHAIVIGGGIAGMTAALSIAESGVSVTIIEREGNLGGARRFESGNTDNAKLVAERIMAVNSHERIQVRTKATIRAAGGSVGCYRLELADGEKLEGGAIIIATGARASVPKVYSSLPSDTDPGSTNYAFLLCDMSQKGPQECLHACCPEAFERAVEIKRRSTDSQVTIFFREIYTAGGAYNDLVWAAQRLGVNLVRYPPAHSPRVLDGEIVTFDELEGREVRIPCDRLFDMSLGSAPENGLPLADMLCVPIDNRGFIPNARLRLYPADRIDRGIYSCGGAHFPCDTFQAILQAYDAAARAVRHIMSKEIVNRAPAAVVEAATCNGCGDCVRVCPFSAIKLVPRGWSSATNLSQISQAPDRTDDRQSIPEPGEGEWGVKPAEVKGSGPGLLKLASVDPMLCTGCGNCASACPVKAAVVSSATERQLEAQILTALGRKGNAQDYSSTRPAALNEPRVLIFACDWSGMSAAEMAGAHHLSYPACTRLIRVNCTGRLYPGVLLKALELGATGAMILGCEPGACHYEQGNQHAEQVFGQAAALASLLGEKERLEVKWVQPDNGDEFVEAVNGFVERLRSGMTRPLRMREEMNLAEGARSHPSLWS